MQHHPLNLLIAIIFTAMAKTEPGVLLTAYSISYAKNSVFLDNKHSGGVA